MTSLQENLGNSSQKVDTGMSERRGEHPRRKRASKACLACRRRKVRCDVAQRGPPCMNCFLDKEDCIVKPRSTKYRINKRDSVSEQAPLVIRNSSTNSPSEHSPKNNVNSPSMEHGDQSLQDVLMGNSGARHEGVEGHTFHGPSNGDHERRLSRAVNIDRAATGASNAFADYKNANVFERPSAEHDLESHSIVNTHIMFSYYPFIKLKGMSKIAPQDVNFLEAQGCFRVPTRPILDEFIQEYFLHIHPILPIINEKSFWKIYDDHDFGSHGTMPISLLVFHAMLFAASSFVSLPSIQKLGFVNNRSARTSYFRRTKLLFEFDGEVDPISLAHATLLMSYFSPMLNIPKANTYWLGISIQFAKQAEAHRYQTKRNVTPEQRNTLKRLWWCCILRDRILPLGVRRSIQVTPLDFDFNTQKPLVIEDFESEFETSRVYDPISKRALAQRLVALCELAVVLTDVILTLYPEKESSTTLDRQSRNDPAGAVRTCKFELNTWFEKTIVRCLTSPGISETHESVLLYTNLMYMYYYSAVIALCNHEVLLATTGRSTGNSGTSGLAQVYNIRRQIEDGITGVTQNLKEIVQLKMAKYMPISVVAYAALPLVLYLLDVKLSSTPFKTAKKQRRLHIYTEAMKALQSQYDVTDTVSENIGKMVEHMSLDSPETQGETPSNHSEADLGSLASKSTDDPSVVQDWGDILLRQPKLYLRLTTTMDLSMSKGSFPKESDFPIALQSKVKPPGGQFPLYHISMDGTKTPVYLHDGLPNTSNTNGDSEGAKEHGTHGLLRSFERPLSFAPNETTSPVIMDSLNFDPTGFELPMGFEAFDMELSSKRGFDFDFPCGETTPFPGTDMSDC